MGIHFTYCICKYCFNNIPHQFCVSFYGDSALLNNYSISNQANYNFNLPMKEYFPVLCFKSTNYFPDTKFYNMQDRSSPLPEDLSSKEPEHIPINTCECENCKPRTFTGLQLLANIATEEVQNKEHESTKIYLKEEKSDLQERKERSTVIVKKENTLETQRDSAILLQEISKNIVQNPISHGATQTRKPHTIPLKKRKTSHVTKTSQEVSFTPQQPFIPEPASHRASNLEPSILTSSKGLEPNPFPSKDLTKKRETEPHETTVAIPQEGSFTQPKTMVPKPASQRATCPEYSPSTSSISGDLTNKRKSESHETISQESSLTQQKIMVPKPASHKVPSLELSSSMSSSARNLELSASSTESNPVPFTSTRLLKKRKAHLHETTFQEARFTPEKTTTSKPVSHRATDPEPSTSSSAIKKRKTLSHETIQQSSHVTPNLDVQKPSLQDKSAIFATKSNPIEESKSVLHDTKSNLHVEPKRSFPLFSNVEKEVKLHTKSSLHDKRSNLATKGSLEASTKDPKIVLQETEMIIKYVKDFPKLSISAESEKKPVLQETTPPESISSSCRQEKSVLDDKKVVNPIPSTSRSQISEKILSKSQKTMSCEHCGKIFTHRGDMNKHMRSHTGEQPYECTICKKKFTHTSNLTRHIRVHSGLKPFNCERCQKSFSRKDKLIMHQKTKLCLKYSKSEEEK